MRKSDRQLPQEETWHILKNAKYGVLNTIGTNGYPYGVPISFVVHKDNIYFHCASNVGSKVENIKNNPKVSFTVIGETEILPDKFSTKFESVIVFGEAKEVSPQTKQEILELIIDKYSKGYEESGLKYIKAAFEKTAIYVIQLHHITGKARK